MNEFFFPSEYFTASIKTTSSGIVYWNPTLPKVSPSIPENNVSTKC